MAVTAVGPAAQIQTAPAGSGGLGTFVNVLQLLKGSQSTTSNNVSAGGINEIVANILRSNQGLAAVAGGEKSAGLYGSTVNTQMINDLVTSAAAKAEVARSSTTTKAPGLLDPKTLLQLGGIMGAQKLLGPAANKLGQPLDDFGQKFADFLSGGSAGGSMSPVGGALSNSSELAAMSNASSVGGAVGANIAGSAGIGNALLADGSIAGAGEVSGLLASANATADPLGAFIGSLGYDVSAAGAGSAAAGAAEIGSAVAGASEVAGLAEAGTAVAGATEGAGILASLTEAATWLASLFSDERLKTDINPVGKTNDGQPIYTYKYIDNPLTTHMGVMAQESPREAVMVDPITKYLRVNYSKIK